MTTGDVTAELCWSAHTGKVFSLSWLGDEMLLSCGPAGQVVRMQCRQTHAFFFLKNSHHFCFVGSMSGIMIKISIRWYAQLNILEFSLSPTYI